MKNRILPGLFITLAFAMPLVVSAQTVKMSADVEAQMITLLQQLVQVLTTKLALLQQAAVMKAPDQSVTTPKGQTLCPQISVDCIVGYHTIPQTGTDANGCPLPAQCVINALPDKAIPTVITACPVASCMMIICPAGQHPVGDNAIIGANGCTTNMCAQHCVADTVTTCTWNGQTVADGMSVTAYQNPTDQNYIKSAVTTGCLSEVRTCSRGVLSGSYSLSSCSTPAPVTTTTGPTITALPSSGAAPVSIRFAVQQTDTTATGWGIDFGDGTSGTLAPMMTMGCNAVGAGCGASLGATHTYTTAGTYAVTAYSSLTKSTTQVAVRTTVTVTGPDIIFGGKQ